MLTVPPRDQPRKKNNPILYVIPESQHCTYTVEICTENIKSLLDKLDIHYKILSKRGNNISIQLIAYKNTWSHQRRKRRHLKKIEAHSTKKMKICTENDTVHVSSNNIVNTSSSTNNNNNDVKDGEGEKIPSTLDNIQDPIVQAFLKVIKKGKEIILQVEYLSGSAGKEGLHQIVQYIKNNWKYLCRFISRTN
jgi:hypothetical protein